MTPVFSAYLTLGAAIVLEVIGTVFLKQSVQFTRLLPTALMGACYLGSFYFLSLALRTLPVGVAYAVWSGIGIVLISTVGWLWFRQQLDVPALIGIGLILAGVVVINAFSESATL